MQIASGTVPMCRSALRLRRAPLRTRSLLTRRYFQSYEHPPSSAHLNAVEESILCAAYRHVPAHGFSQKALNIGAREAGYLDISPSVLSDGIFSLIRYHLVTQRLGLGMTSRTQSGTSDVTAPKEDVSSRLAGITWNRLIANKDIIHQWQDVRLCP